MLRFFGTPGKFWNMSHYTPITLTMSQLKSVDIMADFQTSQRFISLKTSQMCSQFCKGIVKEFLNCLFLIEI